MHHCDLGDLAAFVAVSEHLNFRAAASRLGVTPSALSHKMRKLEDSLGVRLVNRTTRSMSLTDAGMRLAERLTPAINEVAGALEGLNEDRQRPFGRLRIYAGHWPAAVLIAPMWARFTAAYPDVQLELRIDEASIDIVAEGFDAGIAVRERVAADMTAVRVIEPMKVAVVGAPSYFARRRPPRKPSDLSLHNCVQYRWEADGAISEWLFDRNGRSQRLPVDGKLIVNDPYLAVRAAVDGLGITYTIEALADQFLRTGQLVRVLEDWSPSFDGLFLYFSGRRQIPATLRAFIDMVRAPKGNAVKGPFPLEDLTLTAEAS